MSELLQRAADSGELDRQDEHMPGEAFIGLMDSFADAADPAVAWLRQLIAGRGWTEWTRIEKARADGITARRWPRLNRRTHLPGARSSRDHDWRGLSCRVGRCNTRRIHAGPIDPRALSPSWICACPGSTASRPPVGSGPICPTSMLSS